MNTVFYRDRIVFKSYPYAVASVTEQPEIRAGAIKEIRLDRFPSEILLKSGEILFIERRERKNLALFAAINGVAIAERLDIWSLLCEPYVDAEFSRDDQRRNMHQLADAGFLAPEVNDIRHKIKSKMLAYNAVVWDWVNLSHMDVLDAFGFKEGLPFLFFRKAKKRFYDWTHRISARAPLHETPRLDRMERLQAKLLDIAYAVPRQESDNVDMMPSNPDFSGHAEAIKDRLNDVILSAYTAEHRHYHTCQRLLAILETLDSFEITKEESLPLKLAALFQDAVYDTTRQDNEERSAALLRSTMSGFAAAELLDQAARLIMITKNYALASTKTEKYMADADLLVLAQDEKTYDAFAAALRAEYGHVSDDQWREGRLDFLRYIEAQARKNGRIYAYGHPMHEQQALINIRREMARLETAV